MRGLKLCQFESKKPVLLVMGGSLGSVVLNDAIRSNLPELLKDYNVIHLCGKGNVDSSLLELKGYKQFEYVTSELPDLINAADFGLAEGVAALQKVAGLQAISTAVPVTLQLQFVKVK